MRRVSVAIIVSKILTRKEKAALENDKSKSNYLTKRVRSI